LSRSSMRLFVIADLIVKYNRLESSDSSDCELIECPRAVVNS